MNRLRFSITCLISMFIISCNNSPVKVDKTIGLRGDEEQLQRQVLQYPDSFLLRENLVQYYRDKGNYTRAIEETGIALKKDSNNPRFLSIEATLFFEEGDTIAAIRAFEKAIAIDPQLEYIISLGSLYAQTKNPKALDIADTLLRSPGASAENHGLFIKGLYYSYTGNKVKAMAFFNNCLRMDYRYILAYREKAICLYDLKKYSTALEVLEKGLAVQKNFDEAYFWMGRCYEKLGKPKDAIEHYQAALQIDPEYAEATEALNKLGVK